MTDGYISLDALPMIGVMGASRCKKLAEVLVGVGLFDRAEEGYAVHGYLKLNPSRETVLQKRAEDAERKRRGEDRRLVDDRRTPRGIQLDSGAPRAGVPSHPIPSEPIPDAQNASAPPTARSKRPMFTGQRLTVFEWQVDDLMRLLGPHCDAFDLHSWFFDLDAKCVRDGLIPPVRDGGAWLKTECLTEAQHRGMPLHVAEARGNHLGKASTRLAAALANIKAEGV